MTCFVSLLSFNYPHHAFNFSFFLCTPVFLLFPVFLLCGFQNMPKNKIFPPNNKFATNTRDLRGGRGSAPPQTHFFWRCYRSVTLVHATRWLLSLTRRAALPSFHNSRFPHFTLTPPLYSLRTASSTSRTVRRRRDGSMWTGAMRSRSPQSVSEIPPNEH